MSESAPVEVDPRILFAAERTFLAYIRTGLALMGFGFVVARFALFLRQISAAAGIGTKALAKVPNTGASLLIGTALVVIGVIVCAASAPWYLRTVARLQSGQTYTPPRYGIAFFVALSVALIGIVMAAYLIRLSCPYCLGCALKNSHMSGVALICWFGVPEPFRYAFPPG